MTNSQYNVEHLQVMEGILQSLVNQDYREGYEDSVGLRIQKALNIEFPESNIDRVWWNDYCSRIRNETYLRPRLGDGVYDLFISTQEMAHSEGAFVMPSHMPLD